MVGKTFERLAQSAFASEGGRWWRRMVGKGSRLGIRLDQQFSAGGKIVAVRWWRGNLAVGPPDEYMAIVIRHFINDFQMADQLVKYDVRCMDIVGILGFYDI
ncbi:MAG: hypothetical protein PVH22_01260 [Desulfobacteraceae bacterium]